MLDIYKRGNITVNDQWELPIKLGIDWRYSGLKYLTVGIIYLDINRYTYIKNYAFCNPINPIKSISSIPNISV